jgi:hypothetical protein
MWFQLGVLAATLGLLVAFRVMFNAHHRRTRLAVCVVFALQLLNSGASASRVKTQQTEGYIGTSDYWNDSAWRPSEGLDQRVHGHRAGARALPLWVRPIPDHAREAEGGRLTAGRALVRRATHRAGRQARARDAGAAERWTPAPRTERSLVETSKFAERSQRAQDIGALVLMRGDTNALPPALSCGGARARDIQAIMRARARDVGRPVVRLTGGFTSVAQLEERLIPNQQVPGSTPGGRARSGRHEKSTRLGAGNFTDEPCDVGQSLPGTPEQSGDQAPLASGSDLCSLVAEQSAHLSAARARHRGTSDEGVGDLAPSVIVIAQVGLVAFEQRCPACTLRDRAARSARLAHNQEVAGSNPALATRSGALRAECGGYLNACGARNLRGCAARTAQGRTTDPVVTGGESAARPVWRSLVARRGNAEVARSNRVTGPANCLAMVRGETPRLVLGRHETAKRFVSIGGAA